jgi:polyhydroxyalkanoate synthase subunit PhaC
MTVQPAEEIDDLAAPLDALLIDAAFGPIRQLTPDVSVAKFARALAANPGATSQRLRTLAAELARVGAGASDLEPERRDRRFADPEWKQNPLLRRIVQAYVAAGHTVDELIDDADLGWRDNQRVRFLAENLLAAAAPSNVPLLNPASAREARNTGGMSFVRGGLRLVRDLAQAPRIPQMVDKSAFTVGGNLGTTPGAVVLRTEAFELIQYAPQTPTVRKAPMLLVPPTINKFYILDLAPGRSWIEHLVKSGQQVFVLSWRNPDERHAAWGLDSYLQAVLDALDAVERICRTDRTFLTGVCSGGILASVVAAHLASTGRAERLAGLALAVTVLDHKRAGRAAALADRYLAAAATAASRRRGYLDGRVLAEVFAWMRPDDLVWHYWVNNYLLGRKPPAFDVLFWNADTTRMPAKLHGDFVDIALNNRLVQTDGVVALGTPVDLRKVEVDTYVVAGIADHITPWQSCYRTTQLLGGDTRFVLSTSGHIAAIVNPPGNPKATYRINPGNPASSQDWLAGAATEQGSWWPDFDAWLSARGGTTKTSPKRLGGRGLNPLIEAPGTYVIDR